ACGNRYIPFVAGAEWQYESSGAGLTSRFTRKLIDASVTGATSQDQFETLSGELTRTDRWECREGAVVVLSTAALAGVRTEGLSADLTITGNEGITLPPDPRPGDTWSQKVQYGGEVQVAGLRIAAEARLESNCRAVGFETVTVPAGTFEALRVECATAILTKITYPGVGPMEMPVSGTEINWYAAGVGWVKSSSTSSPGSPSETVLLSYRLP
ncbi:MAG: hypothetical protein RMM31_07555, partial [Anaerolineae bacterium]|nr:hypothetical protein [Anaerolineae bacterium]